MNIKTKKIGILRFVLKQINTGVRMERIWEMEMIVYVYIFTIQ